MQARVRAAEVAVNPAATVMLVRDGEQGLEVFMLQRTMSAAFARGQYVFPGGRVDEADHGERFEPVCAGLDDAAASARLGLDHGGLAWFVAAVRECFEEAGVLLATEPGTEELLRFDSDDRTDRFTAARHLVHDHSQSLAELCEAEGLQLLVDRLQFVAHWVTPQGERRRFDTRFFVAEAPRLQNPLHDDNETIASIWVRPSDALDMWRTKQLQMFIPTVNCLEWLGDFATVADVMAGAAAIGIPPRIEPRVILSADERVIAVKIPGDDGYDEVPVPEFVIANPR
jgi:8-oxo-dGTP pyrophosphatase MutT (NUDIX family)